MLAPQGVVSWLSSRVSENIAQRHLRQRMRSRCARCPGPSSTTFIQDVSVEDVLIHDIFIHNLFIYNTGSRDF